MLGYCALLGILIVVSPADSSKRLSAFRVPADVPAPVIDGHLEETLWDQAEVATGFVQSRPSPGAPATLRTEARILYDDEAIYVGMRMYDDAPHLIAAQLSRRDASGTYSDWAHVAIDSYHDRRTAFRFTVNPRGVKKDALHFNDTESDPGWDPVWDVATRIDSLGWTAEYRIPLSQLRFNARGGAEQVWGINFGRDIARTEERVSWSALLPNVPGYASRFGDLDGLHGMRSPRRLEVQPYSLARLTRAPVRDGDPFYRRNDGEATAGADLRYGITSDFTLTATLNPDFGQVEADPAFVNLTAYETFLPEQRPFFMEGTDIFRFGLAAGEGESSGEQLFYSRRIGRVPQRRILAAGGAVDAPGATTILGAAKVTGKTTSGWSFGVLSATTPEEEARYIDPGGTEVRYVATEPWTHYGVVRANKDLNRSHSTIGSILTTTNRRIEAADSLRFLPVASYAGGVSARHRFGDGNYETRVFLLGSRVAGDAIAIRRLQNSPARYFMRPDAHHLHYDPDRTSLAGWSASAELAKMGGGNWRYGGSVSARSPGFETNDLGFQRDADNFIQSAYFQYQESRAGGHFRNWQVTASERAGWTFGGERIITATGFTGAFQLKNFWGGSALLTREQASLSTGALRGGPAIRRPGATGLTAGLNSDRRKRVSLSLNAGASMEDETGGHSWKLSPVMDLRPSAQAEISVRPELGRTVNTWQYLSGVRALDGHARYVLGQLEQTTASVTTRVSYTFTPRFSLQLYAQPFISAGGFSQFRAVQDPRAREFDRRLPVFAHSVGQLVRDPGTGVYRADSDNDGTLDVEMRDPSFNIKYLRSNAVLRWEYHPGSTLFVVWSQGREEALADGSFRFSRDFGRLFGITEERAVPSTNVLLVKVSYWLNH